jgi:hypothetical protein
MAGDGPEAALRLRLRSPSDRLSVAKFREQLQRWTVGKGVRIGKWSSRELGAGR